MDTAEIPDQSERVAHRFVREAGFIPDKFWRESKATLRKMLLEELRDRTPSGVSYQLRDKLLPFFEQFHKQLLGFGMNRFVEQSVQDRIEAIKKQVEEFATSYTTFDIATTGRYPAKTAEDEVISAITSRMTSVFEEKIKTLRDALKGKWHSDARLVVSLAQRLVKRAPPEVLAALEEEVKYDQALGYAPDHVTDIKWRWFGTQKLDLLAKRLITVDTKHSKLDPLKWIDFLQEVFATVYGEGPEEFTEFDLYGMKVVVDDSTVDAMDIKRYVHYFDETYERLRAKGLTKIWYGTLFIRCKECGGANPHTGGGTGGDYPIGPDVVNVYSRPSDFIVELLAHELGHRFWFKFMSETQRGKFEALVKTYPQNGKRPPAKKIQDAREVVWERVHKLQDALDEFEKEFVWKDTDADEKACIDKWAPMLEKLVTEKDPVYDALTSTVSEYDYPELQKAMAEFYTGTENSPEVKLRRFLLSRTILKDLKEYYDANGNWGEGFRMWLHDARIYVKEMGEGAQKYLNKVQEVTKREFDPKDERPVLPVTEYGGSNIDEAFAEVFAYYVIGQDMNRDQLESFKSVLTKTASEEHSEVLKRIDALPKLVGDGCAPSADCVRATDIFSKPVVYAIYGFKRKDLKLAVKASLPVKDIYPVQDFINRDVLKQYVEHPPAELPLVVKHTDGRIFAQEHTRIAAQIMKGATHVTVRLIEYVGKKDETYRKPVLASRVAARFLNR
jgi:hypothetical protein